MKEFTYTVKSATGLHTNHVGLLAMQSKAFKDTSITVSANGQTAKTSQLMRLLGMGITRGSRVTVAAEGPQENDAIDVAQNFFQYYL